MIDKNESEKDKDLGKIAVLIVMCFVLLIIVYVQCVIIIFCARSKTEKVVHISEKTGQAALKT